MIEFRQLPELWRRTDVTLRDLPLALLLGAVSLLPAMHGHGTEVGDLPARPFDGLAYLVVALESLPLIMRRRRPAVCVVLVAAGFAVDGVRDYHVFAATALPIALFSAGAHLVRHRRLVAVLLSAGFVPLAIAVDRHGAPESVEGYVVFYLGMVLSWGVGSWLRSTRAAEADRRRHIAAATRTAERTRIARELHDVVTHHVTAMVVQAEAARYLTAAPERLDETLTAITDTGRRAITDLRHLLDVLNPDHSATPVAGDLSALVQQTRAAGQPVEFTEAGAAAEPVGSAEFVIYRVVQEALTNALKYAHGCRTVVHVDRGPEEIAVEVRTDGTGRRTASPGGSGRGLAGLRERVDVLGGEFHAGPAGAGYVVRARIPGASRS
ncbi:sensor histidine kinase [Actinoplanes sp. N902-109]|uniref:sensor histidine kinase n=1 Tax=Actinoplanes sp. (strain N902-109) TaxID=649831 RepID=UPI000329385F|nr:histidine kinase [Actinoplanes sp. N902-109]AGL21547.1 putative signal transduction histidine kinase [Actinoplanes sp. N902-109]